MKARLWLGWVGTFSLACLVAGNATSDVWVWDFPIEESQVKNGPEPDGSTNSPGKGRGHIESAVPHRRGDEPMRQSSSS